MPLVAEVAKELIAAVTQLIDYAVNYGVPGCAVTHICGDKPLIVAVHLILAHTVGIVYSSTVHSFLQRQVGIGVAPVVVLIQHLIGAGHICGVAVACTAQGDGSFHLKGNARLVSVAVFALIAHYQAVLHPLLPYGDINSPVCRLLIPECDAFLTVKGLTAEICA